MPRKSRHFGIHWLTGFLPIVGDGRNRRDRGRGFKNDQNPRRVAGDNIDHLQNRNLCAIGIDAGNGEVGRANRTHRRHDAADATHALFRIRGIENFHRGDVGIVDGCNWVFYRGRVPKDIKECRGKFDLHGIRKIEGKGFGHFKAPIEKRVMFEVRMTKPQLYFNRFALSLACYHIVKIS